jgi:hypothetical protein
MEYLPTATSHHCLAQIYKYLISKKVCPSISLNHVSGAHFRFLIELSVWRQEINALIKLRQELLKGQVYLFNLETLRIHFPNADIVSGEYRVPRNPMIFS